jgi:hypothetical protein
MIAAEAATQRAAAESAEADAPFEQDDARRRSVVAVRSSERSIVGDGGGGGGGSEGSAAAVSVSMHLRDEALSRLIEASDSVETMEELLHLGGRSCGCRTRCALARTG